jgi:hypothetical protein
MEAAGASETSLYGIPGPSQRLSVFLYDVESLSR